ncbi:MAG: HAMP domain-containing histidine kinase, partial [Acidobacteriia bacterium]|nr:HAMP domain-containing histidine kinase [Terriglobia bacterium]
VVLASADGRMELFGPRYRHPPQPGTENVARGEFGFRVEGVPPRRMLFERHHALTGPPRGFAPLLVVPDLASAGWELVVRHRAGSLGEAVAGMRRRNLGFSFGVLIVLAAGMVLIIVWTQRVQKLAKLQMDFVTGVSHELRTPVSVICSAAENLADGVVDTASQVKQYGALIRNEGRRLREMVEQILLFASGQERRLALDFRPVDIGEVIDSTLVEAENLVGASGFAVEKQVSPNLPPVMADPAALSQCLRNLITNALKYGAANRWMAVHAQTGDGPQGEEIQITVQDRGQGIDPEDLPHVFEPFYRGSAARSSQIHGTGLGLSLVKELTEALGGRLTVMSTPGEGSSFTLHLPVARLEAEPLAKAG